MGSFRATFTISTFLPEHSFMLKSYGVVAHKILVSAPVPWIGDLGLGDWGLGLDNTKQAYTWSIRDVTCLTLRWGLQLRHRSVDRKLKRLEKNISAKNPHSICFESAPRLTDSNWLSLLYQCTQSVARFGCDLRNNEVNTRWCHRA